MAEFAQMRTMDIWYAHLAEDELRSAIRATVAQAAKAAKGKKGKKAAKRKAGKRAEKTAEKAHTRDSLQALSKLGEVVDGRYRIVSQPPVVVPARDLAATYGLSAGALSRVIRDQFRAYRATLPDDRRQLLERFEIVDMARKVVGVGSVGTRAFIVLLQGRDEHDPLFLQVKEATASVLEGHLRRSRYRQPGERVVQGQRMMQAASDIYLGWTKGVQANRYFYWRQLRDMKGSALVESMAPLALSFYARHLRLDPGAGPRPLRRPGRHRRVPGRRRRVRPVDHRLLPALRRPERAGLRGVRAGGPVRTTRGAGRHLGIGHSSCGCCLACCTAPTNTRMPSPRVSRSRIICAVTTSLAD